ncbi:putative porin [Acinetobacter qingfengensis]|uniref:Putative porin n=1 Tax=Acinetobacter qingfengensis TaxID=1262585 RepID=A0A1E7QWG9_9GAMM|nr:putative porin [Acinetobacter qingfengensis]KAA8731297.1 putative porin [Acinetobacter qingfengensis]OEY91454.1 putative porin [Acinetobacter qingfengensis]
MKKLTIATALLAATASLAAINANAYQAEVGGNYNRIDNDNTKDLNQFGVNGTYYFNQVQVKDSPLAEAAFLDRASNVNAEVKYADNSGNKNTQYGVGAEYFVPNSDFYLSGNVGRSEYKVDNTNIDTKTTTYGAEVGYLPAPGLLVAAGAQGYDTEHGDDDVNPTLRAKYVTTLQNGHDINLEARGVFGSDDNKQYSAGADYYIDKTLSFGADYQKDKAIDQDQWGIRAKKFFDQNLSVEGRLGFGDDYNTYTIGANYRF